MRELLLLIHIVLLTTPVKMFLFLAKLFFRRLCPDISFFQQATDFPCEEIVGGSNSDSIRLHNRVQTNQPLNSGSFERRGIGMNKVSLFKEIIFVLSFKHICFLQKKGVV